MSKKIQYTDEPMDGIRVIPDFLPSPEELVLKDETVKVTISLSKMSVDFFQKTGSEAQHTISKNDQTPSG